MAYILIITFWLVQAIIGVKTTSSELRVDGKDYISVNLRDRRCLYSLKYQVHPR